jgi:hypothetical protein
MGKSLAMSSDGMDFDTFMRKLINAPVPEKKARKSRSKRKKVAGAPKER